ncbi:MAG: hypothetical protein AAGA95_20885 [Pseudomonadota bacterium]
MEHETDHDKSDVLLASFQGLAVTPLCPFLWAAFSVVVAAPFLKVSIVAALIVAFFWFAFCAVFTFGLMALNVLLSPKLRNGVLGRHLFEISESGLREETSFNQSLHKRPSVDRVVSVWRYTLVRVSGSQWHVFPHRSFETEASRRNFFSELEAHLET